MQHRVINHSFSNGNNNINHNSSVAGNNNNHKYKRSKFQCNCIRIISNFFHYLNRYNYQHYYLIKLIYVILFLIICVLLLYIYHYYLHIFNVHTLPDVSHKVFSLPFIPYITRKCLNTVPPHPPHDHDASALRPSIYISNLSAMINWRPLIVNDIENEPNAFDYLAQHSHNYYFLHRLMHSGHVIDDYTKADYIYAPINDVYNTHASLRAIDQHMINHRDAEQPFWELWRKVESVVVNLPEWKYTMGYNWIWLTPHPMSIPPPGPLLTGTIMSTDFTTYGLRKRIYKEDYEMHISKDFLLPYVVRHQTLIDMDLRHTNVMQSRRNVLLYFSGRTITDTPVRRALSKAIRTYINVFEVSDVVFKSSHQHLENLTNANVHTSVIVNEYLHGMIKSKFCLVPKGDTKTSRRLYEAIMSLCIPVVIGDDTELAFENVLDYREFIIFFPENMVKTQFHQLISQLRSMTDTELGRRRDLMNNVWQSLLFTIVKPNTQAYDAFDMIMNELRIRRPFCRRRMKLAACNRRMNLNML